MGDHYQAALRAFVGASGRYLLSGEGLASTPGDMLLWGLTGRGSDDHNIDILRVLRDELGDVLAESDLNVERVYWKLEGISTRLRILEILHLRVLDTPVPVGMETRGIDIAALQAKKAREAMEDAGASLNELSRLIDIATAPPSPRSGTSPSERKEKRLWLRKDAHAETRDARAALAAADAHLSQLDSMPVRAPAEVKS